MKTGRKGFYEELNMKKHLSEITPKMAKHILDVMDGDDKQSKDNLVSRIFPKIIDKALPTQITGEEGGAIIIQVAKEILDKHELNDNSTSDTIRGGEGQA